MVDREGDSHSFHIANVQADTLRESMNRVIDRKSHLMTDELASYNPLGKEYTNHSTVNHSADEYARLGDMFISTQQNAVSAS